MNRASVAAGVPPAVEGGVSPPGIPGSWSPCAIRESWGLSMNLPMQAFARVETGSLTPALSRGERVSRPALGDMPVPRSSEPSRLVPANACLNPANLAEHFLLLPPGEGRDEGRPLHSSRPGSWSPCVSKIWKTFLSMNRSSPRHRTLTPNRTPPASPGSWAVSRSISNRGLSMNRASVAAGVPPAVEGGVSPPGIPGSWSQCAIRESWGLSMNHQDDSLIINSLQRSVLHPPPCRFETVDSPPDLRIRQPLAGPHSCIYGPAFAEAPARFARPFARTS
jgi:hypothetical protein